MVSLLVPPTTVVMPADSALVLKTALLPVPVNSRTSSLEFTMVDKSALVSKVPEFENAKVSLPVPPMREVAFI